MKKLTGAIWTGAGAIMLMTGIMSLNQPDFWLSTLYFLSAGLDFLAAYFNLRNSK